MEFFLDNWYLLALALVSGAMLFAPSLAAGKQTGISAAQAVQKMNKEKATVIDIRTAQEFAAGHIKGAKNLELAQLEQQLPTAVKNKTAPVLFVCNSGVSANRAVAVAKKLGYEQAQLVAGGMKAWRDASLPIATR
ncbi:rhodanese-like domain-containing protein [Allofranklinella schreckenbergeri]|uniref:Rhodanese-like domain-containing protein n=1 Tax=Allofranklinella schreckenbergeri TaxID=1076744 RepID=A0A3M6Q179_9BURK|nr:rhodanese-like domain-containing protein [Allofranklinella schreckenbergeri]MDO4705141.1 rhodanese-like domain-containing protein [Comamonadaceae bacterium]RMW96825.1 rhodanese-like domain-containing protein [Allofranklinella schreckenbergeri]RMX09195.1 rhodanese-like domain-containing protein [Allofranklinella schreckenbergeri]RRD41825.1 rhodanese-like domain-containing protein [Comamonadaceae bacterium OH3737_COT-264]